MGAPTWPPNVRLPGKAGRLYFASMADLYQASMRSAHVSPVRMRTT